MKDNTQPDTTDEQLDIIAEAKRTQYKGGMMSDYRFATCANCGSAEDVSTDTTHCPGCGKTYPAEVLAGQQAEPMALGRPTDRTQQVMDKVLKLARDQLNNYKKQPPQRAGPTNLCAMSEQISRQGGGAMGLLTAQLSRQQEVLKLCEEAISESIDMSLGTIKLLNALAAIDAELAKEGEKS